MRTQKGFSIFELLVAAPIALVSFSVGLPMLQEGMQRSQLKGAADSVHTQLRQARTRTVMEGAPTMVHFSANRAQWQFGMDQGPAISSAQFPDVQMGVIAENDRLGFEPVNGMALSMGQVRLRSDIGEIRVSVQRMGRISTCSPEGELKVKGYADCPRGPGHSIQIASSL